MATLMDPTRVQYLATSGVKAPIYKLYFCRHCLKLRSSDCVSHERDSCYCPNCLENVPLSEAKLRRNRCPSCHNCPSCNHTLSTRATTITVPNPDEPAKLVAKKAFYLSCGFCRWSSRDVGLKDQSVSSGGWPELENPHSKRIAELLDYYHHLAARERVEKDKKKYARRRSYLHLSDKYGLGIAARRRAGNLSMSPLSLKDSDDSKTPKAPVAESLDDIEPLSDDYFTQPLVLTNVATIGQRHFSPEFQPELVKDFYPSQKHFLVKRSQRCRECEHNLSKPEFNPVSIKFKIQLVAVHHVPEIRIMRQPVLEVGKETEVILTLFNPLDSMTNVTLLPTDREDDPWDNAKLELPTCEFVMAPRDDVSEYDDMMGDSSHQFQDDPRVVVFRKANKIGFFIKVVPENPSDRVRVSFRMKYDYKNMALALQSVKQESETFLLSQYVYLDLGPLANQA